MSQKKLSRRDAIKLLSAATGAAMLANLPSKWSTPELASGVLPAHAQTSGIVFTGLCGELPNIPSQGPSTLTFSFTIDPPMSGVLVRWVVASSGAVDIVLPTDGTAATTNGIATLTIGPFIPTSPYGDIRVTWGFVDPVCSQQVFWGGG